MRVGCVNTDLYWFDSKLAIWLFEYLHFPSVSFTGPMSWFVLLCFVYCFFELLVWFFFLPTTVKLFLIGSAAFYSEWVLCEDCLSLPEKFCSCEVFCWFYSIFALGFFIFQYLIDFFSCFSFWYVQFGNLMREQQYPFHYFIWTSILEFWFPINLINFLFDWFPVNFITVKIQSF